MVGGQAVIQSLNQETLIKQSTNKAIINWKAFSILSNESVVFQQPSAQSIALNRVLGGSPSAILGTLTANGQVWLVNPNGVLFGKTATVNATGLLATTADIANADFLSGRYNFGIASPNSTAGIANYGTIDTPGGSTVLAAPIVDNSGTIEARLGAVAVGSGSTFAVDFDGDNLLSFAVKTPAAAGKIDNVGTIAADGGTVELSARAAGNIVDNVINTGGIVQANSVSIHNGTVILDAGQGGSVNVSGVVSAAGAAAGTAGGTVKVLGQNVALAPTASVTVSGAAGGGTVDIGGDFHGVGPDPNAANASIAQGATVAADALNLGNGGRVAVWSSQSTTFNGAISAQGGPQGGNGGYVETSSAVDLSVGTGTVNTRALKGVIGSWLLDPTNVVVANSGGTVTPASIDASTANVTLQATGGDVTFTDAVSMSNNGVGLTAEAGNSIFVNAPITTKGGSLTLSANDPNSSPTGDGQIQLNAALNTAGTNQTGGNVLLTVNGASSAIDLGANITTANGSVTLFDPAILESNVAIVTNAGGSTGAPITVHGTVDDPAGSPGTASLTLNSGTAETDIESDIGDNSALSAFTISGAGQFVLDGDDIRTTSGGVSLTANAIDFDARITTQGGPVQFNGPVTLTGINGGGSQNDKASIDTTAGGAAPAGASVTFNGAVDESVDGTAPLDILAGSGGIVAFNGAVGGIHPLSGLYASGGSIALSAPITTAGPQTYIDPSGGGIILAGNLTDTTATDISLVGSVNVTTPNLIIATAGNVSTGNIVITGSVGGDNNSLTMNAGGASGGLVWNDGTLTCAANSCIEGSTQTLSGTVDTATLDQTKHILLSGDTTFTNASGSLLVTPSIDLEPGAGATLTVTQQAGSTGGIGLAGSLGDGNALGTIAIDSATGGGSIKLGGTAIQTANAPIGLNGPTIVANNLAIDTTVNSASGVSGTGATISFNGTLDDSAELTHTLMLSAGSAGNIDFNARVGSGLLADDGTPLSFLLIESANAVNIDIPTGPNVDGLNAGIFGVNANDFEQMVTPSAATVNAPTSFIGTVQANGSAGGVYIISSGNVDVGLGIYTFGTAGNGGGNVTIDSTQGSVAIEDAPTSLAQIPQSILGSGATAIPNTDALGIAAFGGNAESSGQSPGWGGNVKITAAGNIVLPYGVATGGGSAVYAGSTANGGNAGSISLTSSGGNVYIGAFPASGYSVSGAVNGNIVGIASVGGDAGNTTAPNTAGGGGNGGNGGNVTVTGEQLFVTHIVTAGGAAESVSVTGGAAGNINLAATASSGPAVTIYGQSAPLTTSSGGVNLDAFGGAVGSTVIAIDNGVPFMTLGNAPTGLGGAVTIGGAGGTALTGTSYIQLVDNSSAAAYNGGPAVVLASGGLGAGNLSNVLLNGPVEGAASTEELDIVALGAATVAGPIGDRVPLGSVDLNGLPVNLEGNITTAGGPVSFSDFVGNDVPGEGYGGVVFGGSNGTITINTTANGAAGGSVTFAGTLDDSAIGAHNLTIVAGSGDVSFLGRVGANAASTAGAGGQQTGTTPGTVTIESADNINLQIPLDYPNFNGFSVGSFIVEGSGQNCTSASGCAAGASGSLNADGTNPTDIATVATGNPGPVTIDVSGNIAIGYGILTGGYIAGANGKNVTLIAGGGVTVGDQLPAMSCAPSSSCAVADAVSQPEYFSIFAAGYSAGYDGGSGESASNGGNVFVQGSSIVLPEGVVTSGGGAIIDGATGPGGNAGTIQLLATNGDVWAGVSPTNGAANGNIAGIFAAGGSAAGAPGNGAAVTISGRQLYLTNVITAGGDTELSSLPANTGAAGAITLLASQLSGPAVTLYGEFDPPTGSPTQATLDAFGGETGGTSNGSVLFVNGGTVAGPGGNIVIAGGGGAGNWLPLDISAYVQLVNNSANSSYKGGPTVDIVTGGGSGTTPPSILIDGPIEGTTAGAEALRLDNLINTATPTPFGSIEVNGSIGAQTPLGYVSFFGTPIDLESNITTVAGVLADESGSNSGNLDEYDGAVFFNGAVQLQSDAIVNTAGGDPFGSDTSGGRSGYIYFGDIVASSVDGAHALTLETGGSGSSASVVFCNPNLCTTYSPGPTDVGATTALTELLIRAGKSIYLNDVTTTGSQYYVTGGNDGTVTLYGSTLTAGSGVTPPAGMAGSDIQFLGGVQNDVTNLVVTTNGTISGGEIYVSGTAQGVTGVTLNAGKGLIAYDGTVLPNPNGTTGPVTGTGCPSNITCYEGKTQLVQLTGADTTIEGSALLQSAHVLFTPSEGVTPTSIAIDGNVTPTLDMLSATASPPSLSITNAGDVLGRIGDANPFGQVSLTAPDSGISPLTFTGGIGSPVLPGSLGAVSLSGDPLTLGGSISTRDGAVDTFGPVMLAGNLAIDTTVFDSGNGAAINVGGTIDDSTPGAHSLSLRAGDYIVLDGVGDTVPVGPVSIVVRGGQPDAAVCNTGLCLFGDVTTLNGKIAIDAPTYLDADTTLGTVGTEAHPGTGADIVLSPNTTVDSDPAQPFLYWNFALNAGTGAVTVGAAFGGGNPLGNVTLTSSSRINLGGNIETAGSTGETTSGVVTIDGPVVLANSVTIDSTDSGAFSGAAIALNGTVDAQSVGVQSLTLASLNGAINVGGDIGDTNPLGYLSFNSNHEIALNASLITASNSIDFDGPVVLGSNVTVNTVSSGSGIVFSSTIDDSTAGLHTLMANAGPSDVSIDGAVGSTAPLLGLSLSGASVLIGSNIDTASGGVTLAAQSILLGTGSDDPAIITASGPVIFFGPTILEQNVAVDTTNGGHSAGADVTFGGTLDALNAGVQALTVAAGAGNVNFEGRVGRDVSAIGTEPGAVTIVSADNVNLTMPYGTNEDGFQAGSLSINASGSLDVSQGYISTSQRTGNGGNINITTGSGVYVNGEVEASSGASGGNGGNVTIAAGGPVTIFGCCTLSTFGTTGTGDEQIANAAGVYTHGYTIGGSGQSAGNGGAISITGSSVDLPFGADSNGGDATAVSGVAGGNAGAIALTATAGNVTIGDPVNNGNLTGLYAVGGNSNGGNGGNGGAVTITASDQISFNRIISAGGSTSATSGAGTGSDIKLTANATSGPAVVMYGEAESAQASFTAQGTIEAFGGETGVTFGGTDNLFFTGGTIGNAGGNITIGSSSGQLKGTSFVQLVDNSAAGQYEGGATIYIGTDSNSAATAPNITIRGPIEGTNAGAEAMRIRDLGPSGVLGTVTVGGAIGDQKALGYSSLAGGTVDLYGDITTLPGELADYQSCGGNGCSEVSPAYTGELLLNGVVVLQNDIVLNTVGGAASGSGGNILIGTSSPTSVDGAHALTLQTGTTDGGAVTFAPGTAVGASTPLGALSIAGGAVSLQSVTTSGDVAVTGTRIILGGNITTAGSVGETTSGAVTITGPVTLASPVTVDTTNGGATTGANIAFNGTVDDTSTGNQWLILKANDTPQADLDNAGNCCNNVEGEAQPSTNGGTVTLAGDLGSQVALGEVELTGSQIHLGGNITTSGGQISVFAGNPNVGTAPGLVLTTDGVTTLSTGSGPVNLFYANNIDGTNPGQQGLTIDSNPTAVLPPAVGANVPLGALTVPGPVEVHGNITTAGGVIDFGAGGTVFLSSTLDTTAGNTVPLGADITIGGPLASGNPSLGLTLNGGTGGVVTLGGDVGDGNPFASVYVTGATLDLGGNITTNGGGLAVNIDAATVLENSVTVDTSAGNGNILFGQTDAASAGVQGLTLKAGSGDIDLGNSGPVGGTTPLGAVTLTSSNVQFFSGIITQNGAVTINGGSTPIFNSVTIDTTAGGTSTGANILVNGTIDENCCAGQHALTFNAGTGTATFNGAIGDSLAPASLNVIGASIAFNADVKTTAALTLMGGASGSITATGAIDVGAFILQGGNWSQVAATLPAFAANDFELQGGTFVRALSGRGTSDFPYQLADVYGLQGVGTLLNDNFVQANNIDASSAASWNGGAGFMPIGTTAPFTGGFNGQGKTISNLTINSPMAAVGLFGTNGGIVSNVILANAAVSSTGNGAAVGALAGINTGTIANSSATGSVTGTASSGGDAMLGGLVGYNNGGTIDGGSFANVTVADNANYGDDYLGGLVGRSNGTIVQTYATGAVTGTGSGVDNGWGGLVGALDGGTIDQSFALGEVTNNSSDVPNLGGLVGRQNGGSIANSYASGAVVSHDAASGIYIGGLVGWQTGGSIASSYSVGLVQCPNNGCSQGGLIGVGGGTVDALSFWDVDSSGLTTSAGGVGLTTAQAQSASYLESIGWSFSGSSPWRINDGTSYPYLLWYGHATPVSEIVSGIAPDDATVDLIVDGTLFGNTTAAGNGAYQFLMTSGTTGTALVYLPGGAADAVSALSGSGASGLNLTAANTVYLTGQGGTVATSNLATAEGSASGQGILYGVNGTTVVLNSGIALNVAGGSAGVLVDDAVTASGGAAVTINGASIALAANIAAANGAVSLSAPTVLTADIAITSASATFASTVDGAHNLTVTGNGVFDGAVGGAIELSSLTVTGTSILAGGAVSTTGAQSYDGAVTLGTDNDLTGTTVTFGSTVDGAHNLTVTGNGVFDGVVGGIANLASLTVTGPSNVNGGALTATGTQSYDGAVMLGADTTLTASAATFESTVDTSANNITVVADGITLGAAWAGTGARTLYPLTVGSAVTLAPNAGTTPATFNLDATELGYLAAGSPSMVTIGSASAPQTGAITTGDFTFNVPLTLIGAPIAIDPITKDANTGNLVLNAGGGTATGAVDLGTGDDLIITAGSSSMSGTVNGASGGGAAQYVTANNSCAPCTMNGVSDGSAQQPPPPPSSPSADDGAAQTQAQSNPNTTNPNNANQPAANQTTTTQPPPTQEAVVVQQSTYEPPTAYDPTQTNAPTTVAGIDSGAALFGTISPTAPTDLTVGPVGTDAIVVAYANPPPVKPAANADPQRPPVVNPVAAYLNQMMTPTVPSAGVPGISFGYSLSGNSALW